MVSPRIEVVPRTALSAAHYQAIVELCVRAYDEPFDELMASFTHAVHVLAWSEHSLVSHALWIPRTLYTTHRALHCAYVEAVATEPTEQGRGYATAVLRAMAEHIAKQTPAYDVAALSPSDAGFYARLGWESWTGPLAVRLPTGDLSTPDEEVMILRLEGSQGLVLDESLSCDWREGDVW